MQTSPEAGVSDVEAIQELSSMLHHALRRDGKVFEEVEGLQERLKEDLKSYVLNHLGF